MTELDISMEEFRLYTYADGSTFRISEPDTLWILDSGSHRVGDRAGLVHRPTPGWVGISWKPVPGAVRFVA